MLLRGVMKALPKILLALTAVAALSVVYPAKANLITNPGFETGDFTGWTTSGNADVTGTIFGISPHSGKRLSHPKELELHSARLLWPSKR
jgi:hypothetical protein